MNEKVEIIIHLQSICVKVTEAEAKEYSANPENKELLGRVKMVVAHRESIVKSVEVLSKINFGDIMETQSPAMKRAIQLFMETKGKDVPLEAQRYVKVMAKKVGLCGEVYLTAFSHYAQDIEGLACTEQDYMREAFPKDYYKEINEQA